MRPTKAQERRAHSRKACHLPVSALSWGPIFRAYARNISLGGVFIETPYVLAIDKRIDLMFTIPDHEKVVKVIGKIVQSDPGGLGIQFMDTPERLATTIESLP